jgi:formylglycine-generating enzyme required for sulfatase activity
MPSPFKSRSFRQLPADHQWEIARILGRTERFPTLEDDPAFQDRVKRSWEARREAKKEREVK